jgi:AraC-like DNA-binding protein
VFDAGVISLGLARKAHYPPGASGGQLATNMIMLVLQGELNIQLGKLRGVQKAGMISFCPAGLRYARSNRSAATWWIYFHLPDVKIWEQLKQKGPYMRAYEWTPQMLLLVSNLMDARRDQTVNARLNALEDARALGELLRRELRVMSGNKPNRRSLAVRKLAVEIHSAPEKNWTVSEMARKAGIPPRTLSRMFKNELGMGPMDLVIKNRLDLASTILMSTDDTIESIARRLGYKSLYSFSNLFYRHIGMRPGQFRKKCQADLETSVN